MSNARNLARLLPNASGQLPDAAMASGSVLQVVTNVTQTARSTTSSSWTALGDTLTITPLLASSKIVLIATGQFTGATTAKQFLSIIRNGSTEVNGLSYGLVTNESLSGWQNFSCSAVDLPNTTSPVSYAIGGKSANGGSITLLNYGSNGGMGCTLIAMEVAG